MMTLINVAAAVMLGAVILFLIIAIVLLTFANDLPRVHGAEAPERPPNTKLRGALVVVLLAALVGIIIHFVF